MNRRKQWVIRTGLLFILFICGSPLLLADDCSAYSDCFGNLGAAAAAAAAAGALAAGAAMVGNPPKPGFVFMAGKSATSAIHAGPSSKTPVISQQPFGLRLAYRDT